MEKQALCDCEVIHEAVVAETRGKMHPEEEYNRLASLFKMFGDSTRLRILHALEKNELCVCDLAVLLGVTKSAVSHQLKALRLANLAIPFEAGGVKRAVEYAEKILEEAIS